MEFYLFLFSPSGIRARIDMSAPLTGGYATVLESVQQHHPKQIKEYIDPDRINI
jgi:hypothetical protein